MRHFGELDTREEEPELTNANLRERGGVGGMLMPPESLSVYLTKPQYIHAGSETAKRWQFGDWHQPQINRAAP